MCIGPPSHQETEAMPPFLSTRFGKATLHHAPHHEGETQGAPAGGPTASDPKPPRGGGSDLREGQDSLQAFPAVAEGKPVLKLGAPSSWGVIAALQGLEAKSSSSRCVFGKGPLCLAIFPPSHKQVHSTTNMATWIFWLPIPLDAIGIYPVLLSGPWQSPRSLHTSYRKFPMHVFR